MGVLANYKQVFVSDINLNLLAKRCEGYLPVDLEQLLDRAIHENSFKRLDSIQNDNILSDLNSFEITFENFSKAQEKFTPASLKGIKFVKSDKTWNDVGG